MLSVITGAPCALPRHLAGPSCLLAVDFLVDFLAGGMLVASCCGETKKAGDVEVMVSASGVI